MTDTRRARAQLANCTSLLNRDSVGPFRTRPQRGNHKEGARGTATLTLCLPSVLLLVSCAGQRGSERHNWRHLFEGDHER